MQRTRPLIVEFAGMPQTGKDTIIDILSHYLKRNGFREYVCQEGARTCPIYKDDRLLYASWIIHRVALEITEIATVHRGRYDVSILNRGIFDALAFFYLLSQKGIISNEYWLSTRDYFTLNTWTELTDVVFLFKAEAITSISRELEDKLVKTDGVVMNLDTLQTLELAYQHIQEALEKKCKIVVIDSQNKSIRECAQMIANQVHSLLH